MTDFDCIIIGRGPAGLSAALYLARANMRTLVIGKDDGALAKAERVENYFGASGAPSGSELIKKGCDQALALGATLLQGEVMSVELDENGFVVECDNARYTATAVILATGAQRQSATVKNAAAFDGRGLSYCAVCDAFFYRGLTVAVLGDKDYALHELSVLHPIAKKCYLLTDGKPAPKLPLEMQDVICITTAIDRLEGDERLQYVVFADGARIETDGLFVALGVAGAGALARKAGAEVDGQSIKVDASCRTTLPGLFAAGDCIGGVLQASVAVGEGASAALSAIAYIKKNKK